MDSLAEVPPCELRIVSQEMLRCAHPRVHAGGQVVTAPFCRVCPQRAVPADPRPPEQMDELLADHQARAAVGDCRHRGAGLREEKNELCGCQGATAEVYACAVHGECSLRRYKSGQSPITCLDCKLDAKGYAPPAAAGDPPEGIGSSDGLAKQKPSGQNDRSLSSAELTGTNTSPARTPSGGSPAAGGSSSANISEESRGQAPRLTDVGKSRGQAPRLTDVLFGITAFNRPRHLERMVESILRFYPAAQILVADNGEQRANLPASVEVLRLPFDCGLSAARNALIDRCRLPYLLILEEDFVFTVETRLESLLDVLESDADVGCVAGILRQGNHLTRAALDFDSFRGELLGALSTRPLKEARRGTQYRYAHKVPNFFLARRRFVVDHRWRDALKVGEHAAFFVDVLRAARWRVASTDDCIVSHDVTGRDAGYLAHRRRAVAMHNQAMRELGWPRGHSGHCEPIAVIPRTIHRIWLGQTRMPEEFVQYGFTWQRLNPDWHVRDWREPDVEQLGPLVTGDLWKRVPSYAQQADILRLEILYRLGGVYVDTDFEALKPLGKILDSATFAAALESPQQRILCNAFIAAARRHRVVADALEMLPGRVAQGLPINQASGPHLLTTAWRKHEGEPGVTIFGPERLYPYLWHEKGRRHQKFPNAIAVHHWQGSWRQAAKTAPLCIVLMTPRCGSSWLLDLLRSVGLGDGAEWFHRRHELGNGLSDGPELLGKLIERTRGPRGIATIKATPEAWTPFYETVKHEPAIAGARYVHLVRMDGLRQAISYRRAQLTDQWRDDGRNAPVRLPEIEPEHVRARFEEISRSNTAAAQWLSARGLRALHVIYEELQADPRSVVERIAAWLGVTDELGPLESTLRIQRDAHTERVLEQL